MPETVYTDEAISSIVYYGNYPTTEDTDEVGGCGCAFSVLDTLDQLSLILEPKKYDVAIIKGKDPLSGSANTSNIVYMAIYDGTQWRIYNMKGAQGVQGLRGLTGAKGDKGEAGKDGDAGTDGAPGLAPDHQWKETFLRFRKPDGLWGELVDLKGDKGDSGNDGNDGSKGDRPDHQWTDTGIAFEKPDGTYGDVVELKGDQGDQGEKGDAPAHEYNPNAPTEIRFQNPDGSWGNYQDFKGDTGEKGDTGDQGEKGDAPAYEVVDGNLRFELPAGGFGDDIPVSVERFGGTDPGTVVGSDEWSTLNDQGKFQVVLEQLEDALARIAVLESA